MRTTIRIVKILFWVLGLPVLVMTIYNLYRQEINLSAPPLINILPDWHWAIWLSILLFILLARLIIEIYTKSSDVSGNTYRKSPVIGHDNFGDNTYGDKVGGDKLIDSIKGSFNNTPVEFYRPKRSELAYHIGIEIDGFAKKFESVRRNILRERFDKYSEARKLFNKIRDERLPQSRIFANYQSIKDVLSELNLLLESYGNTLGFMENDEHERTSYGKPSDELIERIKKDWDSLWGDGGKEDQIKSLIQRLHDLLNLERD